MQESLVAQENLVVRGPEKRPLDTDRDQSQIILNLKAILQGLV
jgi:hypothetical protein